MRKKMITGALLAMMCLSLAACGKDDAVKTDTSTTVETVAGTETDSATVSDVAMDDIKAEELVNMIAPKEGETSISADMIMDVDMHMAMQIGTEGDVQSTPIDMVMYSNIKVMSDDNTTFASGSTNMSYTMNGEVQKETQVLETYTEKSEDGTLVTYDKNAETGKYTKQVGSGSIAFSKDYTNKINADIIQDLNVEQADGQYVVTGKIKITDMGDMSTSATNIGTVNENAMVDFKACFNSDKKCTSLAFDFGNVFDLAATGVDSADFKVNTFKITLDNLKYSNTEVNVPDEVYENIDDVELNDTQATDTDSSKSTEVPVSDCGFDEDTKGTTAE